jgi:hypothetical protein
VIALALLASHLVGDFVLQTRWQANGKLTDWRLRTRHVVAYGAPFYVWVPFLDIAAWRVWTFLGLLLVLHFLTDSRRFHSTLGDVYGWRQMPKADRNAEWQEYVIVDEDDYANPQPVPDEWLDWPTPNPWLSLPLMIDQTLHVVQLALLALLLT